MPHTDEKDTAHTSEGNVIHDVNQSIHFDDMQISRESSHSYQFVLSATSLHEIKTRVALQKPVPMKVPEHLNTWFYTAVKAFAIQTGSLCRYTVPTLNLKFLKSPQCSADCTTIDSQLITVLLPQRDVEMEQMHRLLPQISEGWLEVDRQTERFYESVLKTGQRPILMRNSKSVLIKDDKKVPLAYAAVLAWHWLIVAKVVGSHLTSAEVTEGLLNGMIANK